MGLLGKPTLSGNPHIRGSVSHVPGHCRSLRNPPNPLGPPSHSKPRQFVRQLLMLRALLEFTPIFGEFPIRFPYIWGNET